MYYTAMGLAMLKFVGHKQYIEEMLKTKCLVEERDDLMGWKWMIGQGMSANTMQYI